MVPSIAAFVRMPPRPADALVERLWSAFLTAIVLPLLVPYSLLLAIGGSAFRLLFPAYVLGVALALLSSRRWLYPTFIIGAFVFCSFLRRLADFHSGFALLNLVLLAPYVGLLPTLPALLRRVLGQRPGPVWPFGIFVFCTVYGTFMALLNGAPLVSTPYEAARWLLPIAFGVFILDEPAGSDAIRRSLIAAMYFILPILSAYGVYQFLYAPPWDVYWMVNIDNVTFGTPAPFGIRVFSMLNAPFSCAAYVAIAMILLAGEGLAGTALAALGVPVLALSLVRSAWLGLVVGGLVLLLNAPPARKLALVLGSLGAAFLFAGLLASPDVSPLIANTITDRFATFQDLNTDTSSLDRLQVYDSFYQRLAESPFGEGVGASASSFSLVAHQATSFLDSGILETILTFGVVVGTAYFIAIGALLWRAVGATRRDPARLAGCMAVVASVEVMSFLASAQLGEVGVLGWAAFGIVLAGGVESAPRRAAAPRSRRARGRKQQRFASL
jgi:O-antigen ligase